MRALVETSKKTRQDTSAGASSLERSPAPNRGDGRVADTDHTPGGPGHDFGRVAAHPRYALATGPDRVVQRTCKACDEEEEGEVRRTSAPDAGRTPSDGGIVNEALQRDIGLSRSEAQPLPSFLRSGFERRFGARFHDVRVVTGPTAAHLNDSLQARAFTIGNHIWFGRGEYRPRDPSGQRLVAHELAHTLQQRAGPPTPSAALKLGSRSDPAEAEADRVADAVMSGRKAPPVVSHRPPALRLEPRRPRPCAVTRGSEDNQLRVRCGSERYRVTFSLHSRREPETRVDVTPGIDFSNVFFDLEICRGGTRVRVRPSVNLTGALRDMVPNLVRGDPLLEGVTVDPELEVEITISESVSGTIRGGPIIDPRTGDVIGGGVTLEVPLGRPERVDCTRERRFLRLRCERLTTVPGRRARPAVTDQQRRHVFFLFPYAQAGPVREVRLGVENETPALVADPEPRLQELAARGFRVKSVRGFASPEGPRQPRRPGGFQGNVELARERGEAARTWLETHCAQCDASSIPAEGRGELHSPGTTPETEGRRLTRHVTPEFLGEPQEPGGPLRAGDPLRPATEQERAALAGSAPAQQRARIFPLLRRAHVIMERTVVVEPARPAVPAREEAGVVACPAVVRNAVRNFLGLGL